MVTIAASGCVRSLSPVQGESPFELVAPIHIIHIIHIMHIIHIIHIIHMFNIF